jgi:hypothetical protein
LHWQEEKEHIMFGKKENQKEHWRDGTFLVTVNNSIEADILESKLKAEGIPVMRRYEGFANAAEIIMGSNTAFQLDLYVPEDALEDAKNIIIPLTQEEIEGLDAIEEADRLEDLEATEDGPTCEQVREEDQDDMEEVGAADDILEVNQNKK